MRFASAAGFDDSIGWTNVATSRNTIAGPAAFVSRFWENSAKRQKNRRPVNNAQQYTNTHLQQQKQQKQRQQSVYIHAHVGDRPRPTFLYV